MVVRSVQFVRWQFDSSFLCNSFNHGESFILFACSLEIPEYTSKITAVSARYIHISEKYPTNHIKAKFEPFPAVFQRYISLLATIPLQYIPKSRICNIFRLFFKMGKHRVRLSADHSLSGEPEPLLPQFQQKKQVLFWCRPAINCQ